MILPSSKLMLTAFVSTMCVISAVPAEAGCHGRSGGSSYGSSYSSRVNYAQPVYSSPVYSQPVYPQPVYPQPVYAQSQPVYGQTQPVNQYGPGPQAYPSQQGFPSHQGFPSQQGIQGQPGFGAQQGYPAAGQTVPGGTPPMTQSGSFANGSANGSTTVAGQPQLGMPGSGAAGASAVSNGGVQAPVGGASANSSFNDPQQSALQALGGFAPPQTMTVAPSATSSSVQPGMPTEQTSLVGTWTANLANGARIQLALQADGTFSWTALNKEGQSSVFQGMYAVENGSLSLTRSNDSQKLSGVVTTTGTNTFSFKLSVAQSPGIDFVRG